MKRRDFIQMAGMGAGAMAIPFTGLAHEVDIAHMLTPLLDTAQKKQLADIALNTAKSLGASTKSTYNGSAVFATCEFWAIRRFPRSLNC